MDWSKLTLKPVVVDHHADSCQCPDCECMREQDAYYRQASPEERAEIDQMK